MSIFIVGTGSVLLESYDNVFQFEAYNMEKEDMLKYFTSGELMEHLIKTRDVSIGIFDKAIKEIEGKS